MMDGTAIGSAAPAPALKGLDDTRRSPTDARQATDEVRSVFSALLAQAGHEGWASAREPAAPVDAQRAVASWESWLQAHPGAYSFELRGSPSVRPGKGLDDLRADYGRILQQAVQSGAYAVPEAYVRTLSREDLATLQQVAHLADPIDPASLSREAAMNLLLPPGASVDLDGNGAMAVGRAMTGFFPDSRTPPEVCAAWDAATAGLSQQDKLMRMGSILFDPGPQNVHVDARGAVMRVAFPGDADYVNPRAAAGFDYAQYAAARLETLERFRGQIDAEQYRQDRAFWQVFRDALEPPSR